MHRAAPTHALQLGTAQAEASTPAERGTEVTKGWLPTPSYRAYPHLVTGTLERSKRPSHRSLDRVMRSRYAQHDVYAKLEHGHQSRETG